jgi:hypothetical protein
MSPVPSSNKPSSSEDPGVNLSTSEHRSLKKFLSHHVVWEGME